MWVKPRQTIREIIALNPSYRFYLLCLVYGFPVMLYFAQQSSLGQSMPVAAIFFFALIFSVLIGIIGMNIGAFLLYWTGKWIGGVGTYKQVRASIAWSNVTNVVNCLIWVLLAGLFGGEVFLADFPVVPFTGRLLYVMNFIFLIQLVVSIWSFIIFLKSLGEVQGFSAWKALLNFLIPILVVFIGLWLVGFIIGLFSHPGAA